MNLFLLPHNVKEPDHSRKLFEPVGAKEVCVLMDHIPDRDAAAAAMTLYPPVPSLPEQETYQVQDFRLKRAMMFLDEIAGVESAQTVEQSDQSGTSASLFETPAANLSLREEKKRELTNPMIAEEQNPADTTSRRAPTSSVLQEMKGHHALIKNIFPGAVSSEGVVYTNKKSSKLAESKKTDVPSYARYNEKLSSQQSERKVVTLPTGEKFLVGPQKETLVAVKSGGARIVHCTFCRVQLYVSRSAKYVLCADCKTVSSMTEMSTSLPNGVSVETNRPDVGM